ncbi:hypothetical protein [Novipirellula sp.]|uniref:hypothetical protein n=1 Tax=Novipirellula sp. TaxID=2795430 RepID=UPI003564B147
MRIHSEFLKVCRAPSNKYALLAKAEIFKKASSRRCPDVRDADRSASRGNAIATELSSPDRHNRYDSSHRHCRSGKRFESRGVLRGNQLEATGMTYIPKGGFQSRNRRPCPAGAGLTANAMNPLRWEKPC